MACDNCAITVFLDGKRHHVKLFFENLKELAWSNERNCFLYQCHACHTLWQSCGYEKAATEIAIAEARRAYPDAIIRE